MRSSRHDQPPPEIRSAQFLTITTRSPDPTEPDDGCRPSVAARIRSMGDARLGAIALLVATLAAVVWANVSYSSYHDFWALRVGAFAGDEHLDFTMHSIVNDALMAIFFFSVGLEVRREFAIGELTNARRALVPVVAALAGLVVPAVLFAVIASSTGHAGAWGVVISTDTAFLVGALALIGPSTPGRLRVFLLALAVVDDIGALAIIAGVYTDDLTWWPLVVAAVGLVGIFATRYLPQGRPLAYTVLALIVWIAFLRSGVHPTLAGVAVAMAVPVYRPDRRQVEHALDLARSFQQSPNTRYARAAANSLRSSISVNERLQHAYAPYIAYLVLPLFALANAGVRLNGEILAAAIRSPLTWGVIVGLVIGKFVGVFGSSVILKKLGIGEFGPGLTLDRIAGGAALCGIGFTISLFIIDLAIDDAAAQNEARVGVLAASVLAFAAGAVVFRIAERLRPVDDSSHVLARPVDPRRDHIAGPVDAPLTMVEYGDYQCDFCLRASGAIDEVRRELGDELRYVWRHAPLEHHHPNAVAAAEASEAAARQGAFFAYGRTLMADQDRQLPSDIMRRAEDLDLDLEQFEYDLTSAEVSARVRDDMLDAEAMDITAVPTFYVNGARLVGPHDAQTLIRQLRATDPRGR